MTEKGSLALGMITKNEQYYLSMLIPPIRNLFDEFVVVDSESQDTTCDVLEKHGATIINKKWINDYSSARNEVLRNIKSDWVLMLDADESMTPGALTSLRECLDADPRVIYEFPRLEFVGNYSHCDRRCYPDYQARLFNTGYSYYYRNPIHEILYKGEESKSAWENGYTQKLESFIIYHYGQCRHQYDIALKRYNYERIKRGENTVRHLPADHKNNREIGNEKYEEPHPMSGISDKWITAPVSAMSIEGWMSRTELQWLSEMSAILDTIVEVGSWKGRSTKALGASARGVIISVDHFMGSATSSGQAMQEISKMGTSGIREIFRGNLREEINDGKVIPVEMNSKDAVEVVTKISKDRHVDMVFIDSDHSYESVRDEIRRWEPSVRKGGIICGHDYSKAWPGVMRAVNERYGKDIRVFDTIWNYKIK